MRQSVETYGTPRQGEGRAVCASDWKKKTHVIGINPSQITTEDLAVSLRPAANYVPTDGYSKVAAVERHHNTGKIGVAVAKGYGIRNGAVASSVSHDSHNIIVIGDNDRDMALAVDEIIRTQGGYTVVENGEVFETLPLPIMGLMSDAGFESVNETLGRMIKKRMKWAFRRISSRSSHYRFWHFPSFRRCALRRAVCAC